MTDLVVVGDGPAGVAAALTAARGGLSVILLRPPSPDRRDGLRPTESVPEDVSALLVEIDAQDVLHGAGRARYGGMWRDGVYSESSGWHIDRGAFDSALGNKVGEAGIECVVGPAAELLVYGDRVVGVATRGGDSLEGRYVIDATGRRRFAARSLGLERRFESAPAVVRTAVFAGRIPGGRADDPYAPMFSKRDPGWLWLAPEPGDLVTLTEWRPADRSWQSLPFGLEEEQRRSPWRFCDARWQLCRPLVKEGLVIAGEAGGSLDPSSGHGILLALMSGIMAARAVGRSIVRPELAVLFLTAYDDWYLNELVKRVAMLKKTA